MDSTGNPITVAELAKEIHALQQRKKPTKMEFSKKAFIFASIMFFLTWMASVYSWFAIGEIPWEFSQWISLMYGAVFASYCGKSAYENKPKVETWGEGGGV